MIAALQLNKCCCLNVTQWEETQVVPKSVGNQMYWCTPLKLWHSGNRGKRLSEFKGSLIYIVSLKTTTTTQRDTVSKKVLKTRKGKGQPFRIAARQEYKVINSFNRDMTKFAVSHSLIVKHNLWRKIGKCCKDLENIHTISETF